MSQILMPITLIVKTIIIEVIFVSKFIGKGVGSIIEITLRQHLVSTRMAQMGDCLGKIFHKILNLWLTVPLCMTERNTGNRKH